MYSIINQQVQKIITHLQQGNQFVTTYPSLLARLSQIDVSMDVDYQSRYRKFWAMNQARLGDDFYRLYFHILQDNKGNTNIRNEISNILKRLYEIPSRNKGTKKYQFSFVSKLCHMINPNLPVYDKMVKAFYFLPEIDTSNPIESFLSQYNFLINEYNRVINSNLLSVAIPQFENSNLGRLNYSNTKKIDCLIWAYVDLLYKRQFNVAEIYK